MADTNQLSRQERHLVHQIHPAKVDADDGLVPLGIRDNGVGGADPARGSGLVGLKDRLEATGGTLRVERAQLRCADQAMLNGPRWFLIRSRRPVRRTRRLLAGSSSSSAAGYTGALSVVTSMGVTLVAPIARSKNRWASLASRRGETTSTTCLN
jgi:hypothetical protein